MKRLHLTSKKNSKFITEQPTANSVGALVTYIIEKLFAGTYNPE
jgi:hypothetical protein